MAVKGGIKGLHFVSRMDNSQLRTGASEAKGIIGGLGKFSQGAFEQMMPITGIVAAGAALVKLGSDAERLASDYEMAMKEVETISKATQENFSGISDEILTIAANGPHNAIELAKAYYQIVSAGHDGADGLRILETASKAATAGVTDTKTAADGLTTVLNAWGKSASEAERVADSMFTTVRLGKTTFAELSSNIAQVAPLASSMNVELEQVLAGVSALTVQGTPTAQAMTQIRSALVNMNKVLGDGWANSMTFQEGLNKIAEKAGGSQNELKKLIPDIEGVNAVLGLTGDKASVAKTHLEEMATTAGAMKTAYETMMEAADNKWKEVENLWHRRLIQLGNALKAGGIKIADALKELLQDNQKDIIDPKIKGNINELTKAFAGLDPVKDKEKMLEIYVQKYLAFEEKRKKVANEVSELEKNQPGIVQKSLERTNVALFGPNAYAPGFTREVELEIAKNELAALVQTKQAFEDIYNQIITGTFKTTKNKPTGVTGGGGGGQSAAKGVVGKAREIINNLKEELENAPTEEAAVKITLKIAKQEAVIDAFNKKVREGIKKEVDAPEAEKTRKIADLEKELAELNKAELKTDEERKRNLARRLEILKEITALEAKPAEMKSITPKISTPAVDSKTLATVKGITEEEKKRLKIQGQIEDARNDEREALEEQKEQLNNIVGIMGQLVEFADKYSEQLGMSGKEVEKLKDGMSILQQAASGNKAGAIAGIILMAIKNLTDNQKETKEYIEKAKEKQLESLQEYYSYMTQMSDIIDRSIAHAFGTEKVKKMQGELFHTASQLNSLVSSINTGLSQSEKLKNISMSLVGMPGYGTTSTASGRDRENGGYLFNMDDIDKFIEENEMAYRDLVTKYAETSDKAKQEMLKQYGDYLERLYQYRDQVMQEVTGTTMEAIADSILDGFKAGKNSMVEFADDFQRLMSNALAASFKQRILDEQLEKFYTDLNRAASDSDGLTEAEIALFKTQYAEIIAGANKAWENIKMVSGMDIAGQTSAKQQGITGEYQSLTEATGTMIGGQFFAMRELGQKTYDLLRTTSPTFQEQLSVANESLMVLNKIEQNTQPISKLGNIEGQLYQMNQTLKDRL